jgi:ankyrin repeat protein
MNVNSSFNRLFPPLFSRLAIAMLVAMAWSSLAFCAEIHEAAKSGDLEKVKALLEENSNLVFGKDTDDRTPLHWAAARDHKNAAELLLANKANVNAKDDAGWTPLHAGVQFGYKEMAGLLLAHGAEVNAKNEDGQTPLHLAARSGSKDLVELLLAHGAQVNAMNNKGGKRINSTPILNDHKEAVMNMREDDGRTPLHDAALNGHKDVAELLLAHGAKVNAKNVDYVDMKRLDEKLRRLDSSDYIEPDGLTPLHLAVVNGHKDVAKLLLANKAAINVKSREGHTPLHLAARMGHKDVAELLLTGKAEVNAKNIFGQTPLHDAARNGRKDMAELLLAHGAEVNAKDIFDETLLHLAVRSGYKDVAELLRQHGGQ